MANAWRARFRYRFDTFMAHGGSSIFITLTLVFLVIFVLLAALRATLSLAFPEADFRHMERGLWGHVYTTFLEMTDPGNMVQDLESSIGYKVVGVLAGLVGIVLLSSLIGFITTALDQRISDLKKGRSKIFESDHTLLLGWDPQRVVEIVRELIIANESESDACVVILSRRSKEEMDDHLRAQFSNRKTTRLVTRNGNPSSMVDLDIVSVETSKSVVVIAECQDSSSQREKSTSDAKIIQTIMALNTMTESGDNPNIVAEIFDPERRRVLASTFPQNVVTIDTSDVLARLLVQTSRSTGLSVVYNEILSFDGCEMYFFHDDWGGITFRDLGFRFPDGVPMGIRKDDGTLLLNPDVGYSLGADDDVLVLANDDSTIEYRSEPVAEGREIPLAGGRLDRHIERELILGWTPKTRIILEQYADYLLPGSSVDIMIQSPHADDLREIEEIATRLNDLELNVVDKNRLDTDDLMSMEPFGYDNIIILAGTSSELSEQQADSENIVTLLLLRDIFRRHPNTSGSTKLVTEVLDSQNHALVAKAGVKDVIISNRLVSMMLAQISEDHEIRVAYDDLFDDKGSEIYIKPATLYLADLPTQVTFADLMRIAQSRDEVCLGLKIGHLEEIADENFGIKLIPEKAQAFQIHAEDSLIVLAEDES